MSSNMYYVYMHTVQLIIINIELIWNKAFYIIGGVNSRSTFICGIVSN